MQKIWAETPGSFPDEKPKYVPRVNAADFKLNKKYNKVFKQPFEIKTEPTRLQEKYVSYIKTYIKTWKKGTMTMPRMMVIPNSY